MPGAKSQTTADRLRELTKDLEHMAQKFDKRIATEEVMLNRLTFILGDDAGLAKTVQLRRARPPIPSRLSAKQAP